MTNKMSNKPTYSFDQDYNENYSFSEIIQSLSLDEEMKEQTIPDDNLCEIDSDVEELIRKSQQSFSIMRTNSKESSNEKRSKKKIKHRLKKTVKFSFSKPASPETEQIIRVDVTSNIAVETLRQMESGKGKYRSLCSKGCYLKICRARVPGQISGKNVDINICPKMSGCQDTMCQNFTENRTRYKQIHGIKKINF